jgi:hypothetical protein
MFIPVGRIGRLLTSMGGVRRLPGPAVSDDFSNIQALSSMTNCI